MFALMPLTFILSTVAIFDMVFNALLFGSFALLAVSAIEDRPRLRIPAAILLALAVQTKGPVALLLVPLAFAAAALSRDTRAALRRVPWVRTLFAAGVLASPWIIWSWVHFGRRFFDAYILVGNLWLWAAPIYRARFNPFFYFGTFATAFFPWCLLCAGRFVDLARTGAWRRLTPPEAILWAWTAVVFGFFSLSRFKLDHYILPLAPSACLLAADAWQRVAREEAADRPVNRATRVSLVAAAIGLVLVGVAATLALVETDLRASAWTFVVPAAAIVSGVLWGAGLVRTRFRPALRDARLLFAGLLVMYAGVVLFGYPAYTQTRPAARLGQWLAPRVAGDDSVGIYRQLRWEASFRFYAKRPLMKLEKADDLEAVWRWSSRVYCLMLEEDVAALRARGFEVYVAYAEPGVIGTSGRGFRRQVWGPVLIATNHPQG
jgi:4-amino-4-deoxy-L-arabinose transferase-like glycosyltransferase